MSRTASEWKEWWSIVERHPEEMREGVSDIIADLEAAERELDKERVRADALLEKLTMLQRDFSASCTANGTLLRQRDDLVRLGQALRESTKYCERMGVHSGMECAAWDRYLASVKGVDHV